MVGATFPLAVVLKGVDQLSGPLGKAESGLARFGTKALKAGKKLTASLTVPAVAVGAAIIATGASFEEEMINLQALTGTSGEQLEELRTQARGLGADSIFTATQAAKGQGILALAGLETNEILVATPKILDFAAAANLEFADAAGIAVKVMKGQGLQAGDLSRITDTLILAQKSAFVTVGELSEGFGAGGAVMKSFGVEMTETAAALALLNERGQEGAEGGTALRNVIVQLVTPAADARRVLAGGLGLAKADFFDAEGKFLGIANSLEVLRGAGANAEQIMTIFGKRSGPAFLNLVEAGPEKLRELTMKLEANGITQEIASLRMEGATGKTRGLISATQELALAVSDSGLLQWYTDITAKLTDWIRELGKTNPQLLKVGTIVVGVVAAIGPAIIAAGVFAASLSAIGTFATAVWPILALVGTTLTTTVIPAVWSFTTALLANPIGLVVAGVAALVAGIVLLVKHWDVVTATAYKVGNALRNGIGAAFQWVKDKVSSLVAIVPDWLVTAFKYSPAGLVIQGAQALIGGGEAATGAPTGAQADRIEAERRSAARDGAGRESTIRVQFDNVQPGTRISQDDNSIPVDLALGVSLGTG